MLVIMILGVILVISMTVSDLVVRQTKLSVYSSESTQAYYAAESGIEDGLYKLRKGIWTPGSTPTSPVYIDEENENYYFIEITADGPVQVINSIGNYLETRRKIEAKY